MIHLTLCFFYYYIYTPFIYRSFCFFRFGKSYYALRYELYMFIMICNLERIVYMCKN